MAPFTITETIRALTVATEHLELTFSKDDGGLTALQLPGAPSVIAYGEPRPTVDVEAGTVGVWLAERVFVRYLNHTVEERDGAVDITMVIGIGQLMLYDRYRITGTLIARRISVRNVGEDALILRRVRVAVPWARIGELRHCRFEAPGNSVRPHVPLSTAADQRRGVLPRRFFSPGIREGQAFEPAPSHGPGLLALHNDHQQETLLCWYYSETEPAQPQVEGNSAAITLIHDLDLADRLQPEMALNGGTQYILLMRGSWQDALASYRRTLLLLNVHHAAEPRSWLSDAAMYEVHPAEFGGFARMRQALPALRILGINTLLVLPIWDFHNRAGTLWDANWAESGDPYALCDFTGIDPTLGNVEDLRALISTAHDLRMRVLVDLPLAGAASVSRYVEQYPEWFCRTEDGAFLQVPGRDDVYCFDWSNPQLQEQALQQALDHARSLGLDGYRAVLPRQSAINWDVRHTPHASSGALGAARLIERLRAGLESFRPDAAVITSLGGPLYTSVADAAMDELPHHQLVHLGLHRVSPEELSNWLVEHVQALPSGAARICFTESAMTRILNPLADGLRGSLIGRVMMAALVFCGLVPMVRFGQEQSDGPFVARLLQARAQLPALRRGELRLNTITTSLPEILAIWRRSAGQQVIGVINSGPHKRTITLGLPVEEMGLEPGYYTLDDQLGTVQLSAHPAPIWSLAELAMVSLTVEPFGAYCLLLRQVDAPTDTEADTPTGSTTEASPSHPAPALAAVRG